MANTKSAKKAVRVIARRQERNKSVRTEVKSIFKKANTAISTGDKESKTLVQTAEAIIDRAASKGVMHKNKAARKKSRLAKKLNAAKA